MEDKLRTVWLLLEQFTIILDDAPHTLPELQKARELLDIFNEKIDKKIREHPDSSKVDNDKKIDDAALHRHAKKIAEELYALGIRKV
jgi:hypothetical protein